MWQLTQYMVTVDEGFGSELRSLTEDPSKPLEMSTASAETRQQSAKLYGILASWVKKGAGLEHRSCCPKWRQFFEALRQRILAMKLNTQSCGLALLTSITAWPNFQMGKPLQRQPLKLEEVFEDTGRAGTTLADNLKSATLLRSIRGWLKNETHPCSRKSLALG